MGPLDPDLWSAIVLGLLALAATYLACGGPVPRAVRALLWPDDEGS